MAGKRKSANSKSKSQIGQKTAKRPVAKPIKKIKPENEVKNLDKMATEPGKNGEERRNIPDAVLVLICRWAKLAACFFGCLLAAALPPYYHFWTLFVAFSGLLYLLSRASTLRKTAFIGYWFGFGYFGCGFYWIGNALLVDAAETGWLYLPVLFLNGAFFGLFTMVPAMMTKFGRNSLSKIFLFAAGWGLITEWLRSFILTGFPWNPVSSVLTMNPEMMQILSVFGTYGASVLLVFFGAFGAFWLADPSRKKVAGPLLSLGFCLAVWQYGLYVLDKRPYIPDGHSIVVRLVQPSIPQTLKWNPEILEENLQAYIDLSQSHDSAHVDFTIWGETASPFDLMSDYPHNRKVMAAVPRHGYLVTGFLRREDHGYYRVPYNSMAVMNTKGEIEAWYDKNHLVPFGEYMPFRKYLPDWARPIAGMVAEFGRGVKYKNIQVKDYPVFAPLICYEIIFSDEIVKKGANKPAWGIVLTNDGWYGISSGPYQHLVAAQMRAVEEGMTIVRSANSGISAIINPYGEIKTRIPLGERGAADGLVKPEEARQTLFGLYGNIIALGLCGLFLLCGFLASVMQRRKK